VWDFIGLELFMKRNTFHKILNPILVIFALNQATTAIFSEELPHEVFEVLHQGGGFVLLSLIALHFILNFNWVKANYLAKKLEDMKA
jgi:hypothetical protein